MVTGGWKDKASMTLMAGGSATGELTPPHFMFGGGGWPGNIAAAADAGSCVLVKPDTPPEWYVKQNGAASPCHVFGAELKA